MGTRFRLDKDEIIVRKEWRVEKPKRQILKFEGENGGFFVAHVSVYDDGLRVFVYPLADDSVWCAVYARRFVVPQL